MELRFMRHKVSKSLPLTPNPSKTSPAGSLPTLVVQLAVVGAYLLALIYERASVPDGINNDVAEEALRGLYLWFGHHFEVITFAVGNSAETLYLYLVGASAAMLGANHLAIEIVSWAFGVGCILLTAKMATRISEGVPEWLGLLVGATSLWLFHYSRSGLRAICAPVFLAAVALLLDRSERRSDDRLAALACGGVLGLSIYGYTSDRAIVLAFAAYAVWQVWRAGAKRMPALRRYGWITAGAVIVSVPNLLFFAQRPAEFLARGSYVFHGGTSERLTNLVWSILFPFYLPDSYRTFAGPGFQFDGVGASFTAAGFPPIPIVIAAAFLYGLWRSRNFRCGSTAPFLIAAWAAVVLSIGLAGPSPTRLLILFPVFIGFAAAGFAFAVKDWPKLRIPIALLIAGVGVAGGAQYFAAPAALSSFYAGAATSIGEEAGRLAARGDRVICVISGEASVVRYLTYWQRDRVQVVEFYQRPPNPAEIPFDGFKGGVLLLERAPQFALLASRFQADRITHEERFDRVRLPADQSSGLALNLRYRFRCCRSAR